MADSRSLKLTFLGDVSNLTQNINKAENQTAGFGDKMDGIGKKIGVAMAAAAAAVGAFAVKLAVDGVKAAMEDEAAQAKLATTLRNVTGATNEQISAVEAWITKQQLALGVSDMELRPALERLTRATGDVTKGLELTKLALDVSAGSGKSLESVANALGKAYEGNTVSLGKLGLGIEKAELKTMTFDQITAKLAATFKDQASIQADTFAGKVARLSEAWGEAKETVGSFIIDALQPLLDFAVNTLIPMLGDFANAVGEKVKAPMEGVATFIQDVFLPGWRGFYDFISKTLIPTLDKILSPALKRIASEAATVSEKMSDGTDKTAGWQKALDGLSTFITKILAPAIGWLVDKAIAPMLDKLKGFIFMIDVMFTGINTAIMKTVDIAIAAINQLIKAYNAIPFLGNISPIAPVNWNNSGQANFGRVSGSGITVPIVTPTPPPPSGGGSDGGSGSKIPAGSTNDTSAILKEFVTTANTVNTAITATVSYMNSTLDSVLQQLADLKSTPTTINVDASIADPEGTARAIETVLYDSSLRNGSNGLAWVVA